jgi:cytochrome c biogenesis protein CcmG/thiol:disulfide interchange protein DsbE
MKLKILSRLLFLLLIGVILQRWYSERKSVGINLEESIVYTVSDQESVVFPPQSGPALVLFWASWCAPCKVEMSRLKASILAGKIPRERVFAFNPFEDAADAEKFIKKEDYPLTFVSDGGVLAQRLNVTSTPTTLFIEEGKITHRSSGISLWGIWRSEWLFKK